MWTSHLAETVWIAHPSGGCSDVMILMALAEPSVVIRSLKLFKTPADASSEHFKCTARTQSKLNKWNAETMFDDTFISCILVTANLDILSQKMCSYIPVHVV